MGLRKSDMDLNEATVSIERSVVEVGGGLVVKGAQDRSWCQDDRVAAVLDA
jgi:hypothetical protein